MKKRFVIISIILFWVILVTEKSPAQEIKGVNIQGFVSQGFMQSDRNNFLAETEDGTFQFNEMGINFSSDLNEKLRLGVQFFSRDLGELGNNKVTIDWAFGDYHWKDWLGIRAGKIKIPLGFYNETRDIDMVRTSILLPQSVYPEIYRENVIALQGIGFYGDILLGKMGSLSYQAQYGTMDIDEDSGPAKFMESSGYFDVKKFDMKDLYTASLKWETPIGLQLGGSVMKVNIDIDATNNYPMGTAPYTIPAGTSITMETDNYISSVLSAEYMWRNLTISAEYALTSNETQMTMGSLIISPEKKTKFEGYYGSISYRLTDWFELGAYYSEYYPNKDDKDGNTFKAMGQPDYRAWSKDTALTTRFDINQNWTLKLEGHSVNGTALILPNMNTDGTDKNWFLFAAKMTFSF